MYFLLRFVVFDGTKVDQVSMTFPLRIFLFMSIMMNVSSEWSLRGTDKALFREAPFLLVCLYFRLAPDKLKKELVIIENLHILRDFIPEGVLPYMGYIGMCRCEGYGFEAVYSRIGYINQSVWV